MNVSEIRLHNLRRLIEELGGLQQVADKAGTTYDNLWQIHRGTKLPSGKPRGIGNALARQLETGCGKLPGWMDWDNSQPHLDAQSRAVAVYLSQLQPEERSRLFRIIEAATGWAVPDHQVEEAMPITKIPAKKR